MKFTKMQGCGNDYVYVNGFQEKIPAEEKPELVRRLSDRHFGVGGDGVIFINPAENADFEMEMYNADGTRAEMCGNGIRCVAKFVYDKGLTEAEHITVLSAGRIKYLSMVIHRQHPWDRGIVKKVRVNMGSPIFEPEQIPVKTEYIRSAGEGETKDQIVNEPIEVNGKEYSMTCISMGNPHAVVFAEDVRNLDLERIGPAFENHPCFPKRVNTEFVEILDRQHVFMRVWERGTGETLACGTGCCATAAACVLNGLTDSKITVKLLGGELEIEWDRDQNLIYMTGPAEIVFEGEIPEL
ncbi:MAG: diaminopimelate epimerase [Lachnospiraceae bacterium]|nr:diaminopimelate epimerase [Lachnospiraceae bacterium]MCI9674494.1 diaminopimelate epimerase [Lachnospiraceae bacterium]